MNLHRDEGLGSLPAHSLSFFLNTGILGSIPDVCHSLT